MLHQKIIQELQDIPEENLDALYEMIHRFRLSLQKEQSQPRTPGLLTGKLNSSLFEPLPEEELQAWEWATSSTLTSYCGGFLTIRNLKIKIDLSFRIQRTKFSSAVPPLGKLPQCHRLGNCHSATAWEIATKYRIGKLPEAAQIVADYHQILEQAKFVELPIQATHALHAGNLPIDHRDPFDRMLMAQAELENLPIITYDSAFKTGRIQVIN
jgi:PIN domain nuclease of toxin-antitoxin system